MKHEQKQRLKQLKANMPTADAQIPTDFTEFCQKTLKLNLTDYQLEAAELLQNNNDVALRWCRQSGKTHLIAAWLLHHALLNPNTHIAIVGPSWRQTTIPITKINTFLNEIPKTLQNKPQKTIIRLKNQSTIQAFPNNPQNLRGFTLNIVYCVPDYVKVALADGSQIPISQVRVGQQVLSFNNTSGRIEPKRILKVFRNQIGKRTVLRVFHGCGHLDCTADHKVYTSNRGYVASSQLSDEDKILYLAYTAKYKIGARNKVALQGTALRGSRTTHLWQSLRRHVYTETSQQAEKRTACNKPFLKTSGIRSIQVFSPEESCQNSPKASTKQRLGKTDHTILHFITSKIHRNLSNMLSKWAKNYNAKMVAENQLALRISSMVHGRWFSWEKGKPENKYSQIFEGRTSHSTAMVGRSLETEDKNHGRQTWQRILPNVLRQRPRQILQLNPAIRNSDYALQDSSRTETRTMCDMWQTNYAQKSSAFCRKEYCLLEFGMQEDSGETESRVETETTTGMCNLQENLHAAPGKDEDMFACLSENLESSAKEASKNTKQKVFVTSAMPAMWSGVHSIERARENLQYKMSQGTSQKILENTLISQTLRVLWQDLPSSTIKAKILQCKVSGTSTLPKKKDEKEIVYDLEIEDNHNFFVDGVLVSNCDEMSVIPNDEEMFDAISFTLAATNGKFIASSTPWHTDSVFWKLFHTKTFEHFQKSHVTWQQAQAPKGPITQQWLEKKQKEYEGDLWRWRREMLAEWAEDENVWLSQSLITSCIDHGLEYTRFEEEAKGRFYAGLDLGKYQDYSVLAVVQMEDNLLRLVHVHRFPLRTPYASVIGYVKTLCDRWQTIGRVFVDMTGVGDYIVEDMKNSGMSGTEGVKFTQEIKEQLAQWLKQCMVEKRLKIPYDSDLIAELNVSRFELTKEGKIRFSHPEGTNDDRFWSLALACYAARAEPSPQLWVFSKMSKGKVKLQQLLRKLKKHQIVGETK